MKPKSKKHLQENLEFFQENIEENPLLNESMKENVVFRIGSREFEFGSKEHLKILSGLYNGLIALRNCYRPGSANRHVYSAACQKIKKIIEKYYKAE